MNYQVNYLWKKKDCFTHPILDVSEACDWFLFLVPCMLSLGAGAAPGVSIDLVADFQYLRTAYAIDTNLKFSDNLFAALSRFL